MLLLNHGSLPTKSFGPQGVAQWGCLNSDSRPALLPGSKEHPHGCILWHCRGNRQICFFCPKCRSGAFMSPEPTQLCEASETFPCFSSVRGDREPKPCHSLGWWDSAWHLQTWKSSIPPAGIICPHVVNELILTIWLITAIIANTMSNEGKSMVK